MLKVVKKGVADEMPFFFFLLKYFVCISFIIYVLSCSMF